MNEHGTAPAVGFAPEDLPATGQRTGVPPCGGTALSVDEVSAEDAFDPDDGLARWVADMEAGRCRVPDESDLEGPAISISLGDACDLDPALL
ncbi:MAG: hypothetical protein ACRDNO_11060, partial [Trebonia sp.]